MQCNQQISIGKTQTISVTVSDSFEAVYGFPYGSVGNVYNAEVCVKVSDKESESLVISLDTQKTDVHGNTEFQVSITDSYFKVGKTYNVKAFISAKGYRNSESGYKVFFTVNNSQDYI